MLESSFIRVIIPAFNEEDSISKVINDIPDYVDEVIVVNNNSSDQTTEKATSAGATVLEEPIPGYGRACLRGISYINQLPTKTDIVIFLDGDYSDYPAQMSRHLEKIHLHNMDMAIGSRALGNREPGSMTIPQRFGNWLATSLIKLFYNAHFTDLGPFRAIRLSALNQLNMQDKDFGWTVEMQAKAAKQKIRFCEVPVDYRKRIGVSKISGTVRGVILAGYKILFTIFKYL